jgi:hypothetical protein
MAKKSTTNGGWVSVKDSLPEHLQTVWITNGKGWTNLGCLVDTSEGWCWAEISGEVYEHKGEIVAECEIDDLDVQFWHPLPKAIKIK